MPPLNKPYGLHHASEHTTAHKNFDPLPWELYFDEVFYLSDVHVTKVRELPFSEQEMKVLSSFVFMVQVTLLSASQLWQRKSKILVHW